MQLTKNTVWMGGGVTALLVSLAALAQVGCSDSSTSAAAADASADTSLGTVEGGPPIGVPIAVCTGCQVCGGVLGSPTTGISYCTLNCDSGADCPTGTACVANQTSTILRNECIRTCTSAADCTAPFVCRSDLSTPGSYCWTPYPPPAGADSGTPADAGDASVADAGSPADTGAPPDAGAPADTGAPDSALTDGGDAGDGG
jgi:hypothetical protein